MKDLILIGGGGHCKSCIDVVESTGIWSILGVIEKDNTTGMKVFNYPIIGCDNDISSFINPKTYFLITVGQIGAPTVRLKLYNQLKSFGANIATIVSPFAHVSKYANIGEGTIVMHQALVNAGAQIGVNCIINSKVLIEHDAIVDNHCHIATGALINGGVKIGKQSFIGSGVVTKQEISIPDNSFVKANSLVK